MLIEPEERPGSHAGSWYSRWLFERALALIYFTAFLVAVNQFVPLLGKHGLLPVPEWVRHVPFRASPTFFYMFPTDAAFRTAAWLGVTLSAVALTASPAAPAACIRCSQGRLHRQGTRPTQRAPIRVVLVSANAPRAGMRRRRDPRADSGGRDTGATTPPGRAGSNGIRGSHCRPSPALGLLRRRGLAHGARPRSMAGRPRRRLADGAPGVQTARP
jgi:hypothetical protein